MIIKVNPHKCEIIKTLINEKEINVTECEFKFNEEITNNFSKDAYFTLNGETYKQIIVENKCTIPYEVLSKKGQVELGVVAYLVENEEEVVRYNPSPVYFDTLDGSLKDEYENSETITPSDIEQIESALASKQDILISGENIKTINNISILGEGNVNIQGGGATYTAGANIQISPQNVISATDTIYDDTEVKSDIANLQTNKADKSDLNDYYTKNETYTQEEVDNLIGDISNFHYRVVQELPLTGEDNILYLLPKPETRGVNNYYDEYVYANGDYELIGNTEIDLSDYVQKNNIKTTTSTTAGNVYDVTYINTMLGDIESLLGGI